MNVITVKNLCKEYRAHEIRQGVRGTFIDLFNRSYKTIKAVNDISFEVKKGEIIGYIGPNGAGKTTTVKLLSGILSPTSGSINILGLDPFKHRNKYTLNIGIIMGNQSKLFWNLSVIESFKLFGALYEIEKNTLDERIKNFAKTLGVEHLLYKQVRTLSLGERTRCELLLALIHAPPILLLDEPTIGMDVSVKFRIRNFLKDIQKNYGTTIILTSHDMADIEAIATKIIVIDKGKLIFDGSTFDFRREFGLDESVVEIKFKEPIDDKKIFNLFKNFTNICLLKENKFSISLKIKRDAPIFELLTRCNQSSQINSIHIEEEPMTNIVRRIYEKSEQD